MLYPLPLLALAVSDLSVLVIAAFALLKYTPYIISYSIVIILIIIIVIVIVVAGRRVD